MLFTMAKIKECRRSCVEQSYFTFAVHARWKYNQFTHITSSTAAMSLRPLLPAQPCVQQAHAPLHDVLRIGEQYAISGGLFKITPSARAQARILQKIVDSTYPDETLQRDIEAIAEKRHLTADTLLKNIYRTMYKKDWPGKDTVNDLIKSIWGYVKTQGDRL